MRLERGSTEKYGTQTHRLEGNFGEKVTRWLRPRRGSLSLVGAERDVREGRLVTEQSDRGPKTDRLVCVRKQRRWGGRQLRTDPESHGKP